MTKKIVAILMAISLLVIVLALAVSVIYAATPPVLLNAVFIFSLIALAVGMLSLEMARVRIRGSPSNNLVCWLKHQISTMNYNKEAKLLRPNSTASTRPVPQR